MRPIANRGRVPSLHVVIQLLLSTSLFIHAYGRALQEKGFDSEASAPAQKRSEDTLLRSHGDMHVEHNRARGSPAHTVQKAVHFLGRVVPRADRDVQADRRAYNDAVGLSVQAINIMTGRVESGVNKLTLEKLEASGWEVKKPLPGTVWPTGIPAFFARPGFIEPTESRRQRYREIVEVIWPSIQRVQLSNGVYITGFERDSGVLLVIKSHPPEVVVSMDKPTLFPTPGDIIGVSWVESGSPHDHPPLKWWVIPAIDHVTLSVMREIIALKAAAEHKNIEDPPRISKSYWSFSIQSVEGQALIGCPDGMMVASTLARNAANFGGERMVSEVMMFMNEKPPHQWYLAYDIQDAQRVAASLGIPVYAQSLSPPGPNEPVVAGPSRSSPANVGMNIDLPDIDFNPDMDMPDLDPELAALEMLNNNEYLTMTLFEDLGLGEDDP